MAVARQTWIAAALSALSYCHTVNCHNHLLGRDNGIPEQIIWRRRSDPLGARPWPPGRSWSSRVFRCLHGPGFHGRRPATGGDVSAWGSHCRAPQNYRSGAGCACCRLFTASYQDGAFRQRRSDHLDGGPDPSTERASERGARTSPASRHVLGPLGNGADLPHGQPHPLSGLGVASPVARPERGHLGHSGLAGGAAPGGVGWSGADGRLLIVWSPSRRLRDDLACSCTPDCASASRVGA